MPSNRATSLSRVALLGLLCLPACTGGSGEDPITPLDAQRQPVMMAVYNATDFDLVELQVGEEVYGTLASDERADPRLFPYAYRYNYVSAFIQGQGLQITPIDYVGETPLRAGSYTYVIGIEGSAGGSRKLTIGVIPN